MLYEGGAGPIDHVEHQIESVGPPVIGIRYIEVPVLTGVEISEEGEYGVSFTLGLEVAKILEVAAVHRENVVELVKVLDGDAARSALERDPVPHGDLNGARVGRLALVPRPGARRVHAYPVREALLLQTVRQNPFSERRTADVAQAYEENGNVVFRGHVSNSARSGRALKVLNLGAYP